MRTPFVTLPRISDPFGRGSAAFSARVPQGRADKLEASINELSPMNSIQLFATPKPLPDAGLEWEELPSMVDVVLRRHVPQASFELAAELVEQARARLRSEPPAAPVWIETLPAVLDPLTPSGPLAETHIDGLAAREIVEPDVFRHFFHSAAVRTR